MKIRFITSAALALCCSAVFAQSETDDCAKPKCAKTCSNQKRPDIALCNVPPAYNVPARITGCNGSTFEVDASYLYWCIAQEGMDLGISGTFDGTNLDLGTAGTIPTIPNQYQSGFRVGIGTGTTYDDWQVHLGYTYLHRTKNYITGNITTPESLATGATVYDLNDWFSNPPATPLVIAGFSSDWKMDFDSLDLSVSRPFYQGQKLVVTPYTGLLGLSIRQSFNLFAYDVDGEISTSENSYKTWAVGPEVGSNFRWLLGSGFRIEANAEFSLLYMSYYDQAHSQDLSTATIEETGGTIVDQAYLRPYFDLSLGLGYGTYFMNSYHFDLFAGYEFVNLSQQSVLRNNSGLFSGYTSPNNDLNFHGLTVTGRFDF